MTENQIIGLYTVGAAVLGALIAVIFQLTRDINQRKHDAKEAKIERKMEIISDLVAYRYILTERSNTKAAQMKFNSALSRIPIDFIENIEVIDKYRKLGSNFNSDSYHDFIISLIRATRELPSHVDADLLAKVPSIAKPATDEKTIFNFHFDVQDLKKGND